MGASEVLLSVKGESLLRNVARDRVLSALLRTMNLPD
jgi:hypothetical protein